MAYIIAQPCGIQANVSHALAWKRWNSWYFRKSRGSEIRQIDEGPYSQFCSGLVRRIKFKLQQIMRSGCSFRTFWISAPVDQLSRQHSPTSFLDYWLSFCWSCSAFWYLSCTQVFVRRTNSAMAKDDYKGMILAVPLTYCEWRALFIAECKFERL